MATLTSPEKETHVSPAKATSDIPNSYWEEVALELKIPTGKGKVYVDRPCNAYYEEVTPDKAMEGLSHSLLDLFLLWMVRGLP
jgi:hypothetical protein